MFSQFSSAFASSSNPPSAEGPLLIGSEVNVASARAVLNTRYLQDVLNEALDSLTAVDLDSLEPASAQTLLGKAEASLAHVQKEIGLIQRSASSKDVEFARITIQALAEAIRKCRLVYPDTSAVKIDNSKLSIFFPSSALILGLKVTILST